MVLFFRRKKKEIPAVSDSDSSQKIYVIFLMGPSSSGKTYGFDDPFLPQLREDYPDLGTVYKIDGGIMRDASCFMQNQLETTDIDDTERLKIYETYFKPHKVKRNTSKELVKFILEHHYNPINKKFADSCMKWGYSKCNKSTTYDAKEFSGDDYRNKIIEESCIDKVTKTSVNSVESGPNNIGIVYVETFSDISKAGNLEAIKTVIGSDPTGYIYMLIKKKIKFIKDTIETIKGIKDTEIPLIPLLYIVIM